MDQQEDNDSNSENSYGENQQSQQQNGHNRHQRSDDDSGVSDVDSGHHSEYSASASPARLFELDDFVIQPGESTPSTSWADELLEPKEHPILEELDQPPEPSQEQQPVDSLGGQQQNALGYEGLFQSEESSSIFQDLDELFGNSVETVGTAQADEEEAKVESMDFNEYAPDAEDVENQLMHIDDQLIHLDENLDHLDGHLGHLDEATTNTETLLSVDEESFLFEAMPEVMDPFNLGKLRHY